MNTLTVVIPYHGKDLESARRLLNWIHEIGTSPRHSCMLVADAGVEKKDRDELKENACRSFRHVGTLPVNVLPVGFAPNQMFLAAARQIHSTQKLPWLWLEPDCVPLKATWADNLADTYAEVPQKFMGPIVHSTQPGLPATHLTGCSVYPPDAFALYDTVESLKGQNVAWDIESAHLIVPRACHTDLIQHHWGEAGWPPTFVMHKQVGTAYAKNVVDMDFINPKAVLFHRVKDDSLINMLRLQRQSQKIAERPVVEVKRGPGRPPKSSEA